MSLKIGKIAFFSLFRRNENDVKSIYDTFSDLMIIGTGGSFLNFGYWDGKTVDPLQAQLNLTHKLAKFGSFLESDNILDVGSGYCAPALSWLMKYPLLKVISINISGRQLLTAKNNIRKNEWGLYTNFKMNFNDDFDNRLCLLESTSTLLPIMSESMDKIVAFESAQHFKPLKKFVMESNRVLKESGLLVIAIPIISKENNFNYFSELLNLGILKFTWASEHYTLDSIKNILSCCGFSIQEVELIGAKVYIPLADYFIKNRERLFELITSRYPKFFEQILNSSILKMKSASQSGFIDYALIRSAKVIADE
ncbi:MAG TPA: class I SAM-dependent methyltransferase [Candidatus Nitrosocosmicus sp.]|nr:class I SAM-dependent methyltransferase [Candidatus Nitrosocosmicus sp.]